MAQRVEGDGLVKRKNQVPAGLQKVLNRLARVALSNSPCCLYECFAIALESDVDWRTLAELQLAPYVQKIPLFQGDAAYSSAEPESVSKNETSPDELATIRHELEDAELVLNLQPTDECQELASDGEVHDDDDDVLTDEATGQYVHNVIVQQNSSVASDTYDVDVCRALPLSASITNNVFNEDQLEKNALGVFSGRQSPSTTSQHKASHGSINVQEVDVDVKQFTDVNDDTKQLIESDTNYLSAEESTDLDSDRDYFASRHSPRHDNEYVILLDSLYPGISGGESGYKDVDERRSPGADTGTTEMPEVDLVWHSPQNNAIEEPSQITDAEVHYMFSSVDSENSRMSDIPVDRCEQRVKITLDPAKMDTICHNEGPVTGDQVLTLYNCLLDNIGNVSVGFPSAMEFQQNRDCLNASIYASLGGMELRDDMELIPVGDEETGRDSREGTDAISGMDVYMDSTANTTILNDDVAGLNAVLQNCAFLGGMELRDDMELIPVGDEETGRDHSREGTDAISGMDVYMDSTANTTILNDDIAGLNAVLQNCAFLGGMELRDDMELIPVGDEETDTEHSRKDTTTNCDSDSDAYEDADDQQEFSVGMCKAASVCHDKELPETVCSNYSSKAAAQHSLEVTGNNDALFMDDNSETVAWVSDSSIRSLSRQEPTSTSSHKLQYVDAALDSDQENLDYGLASTSTKAVSNSSNAKSEPTDTEDEKDKPPAALESVNSIPEEQNVDTPVTSRTDAASTGWTKVSSNASELLDDSLRETERLDTADEKGKAAAALVSASMNSIPEVQNAETSVSLETSRTDTSSTGLTKVSSNGSESLDDSLSETESLEVIENELECLVGAVSMTKHRSGLPLPNSEEKNETFSTVNYATENSSFSPYVQKEKQLEPLTVDSAYLQPQRLELDDLTLTVTCFIPEENEQDDESEDRADQANDPVTPTDLARYMDHNVASDSVLKKRRSSEFMLSHLLPIDETAEFSDDAIANAEDRVPSELNLTQSDYSFSDRKSEQSNLDEQKTDYTINTTADSPYYLSHEPTAGIQPDDVIAKTEVEKPAADCSLSDRYNTGTKAELDTGCETKCSDTKEKAVRDGSNGSAENLIERNDDSVSESHGPILWISTNHHDAASKVSMNDDVEAFNIARNRAQVSFLQNDEHDTAAELNTTNLLLDVHSDRTSDSIFTLSATDATQYSSPTDSVVKNPEGVSKWDDQEFESKQADLQEITDATENADNKCENTEIAADLGVETFSDDETVHDENSAVTLTDEINSNNKQCKQRTETGLQFFERPGLQTRDIRSELDAVLQNLIQKAYETAQHQQQTTVEEQVSSEIVTHEEASENTGNNSPAMIVRDPTDTEEPASDAITDFESTLERLHCVHHSAYTDEA